MTKEDLKFIATYAPSCLCGHGEDCSVCTRSDYTRKFEELSIKLAREILKSHEYEEK